MQLTTNKIIFTICIFVKFKYIFKFKHMSVQPIHQVAALIKLIKESKFNFLEQDESYAKQILARLVSRRQYLQKQLHYKMLLDNNIEHQINCLLHKIDHKLKSLQLSQEQTLTKEMIEQLKTQKGAIEDKMNNEIPSQKKSHRILSLLLELQSKRTKKQV